MGNFTEIPSKLEENKSQLGNYFFEYNTILENYFNHHLSVIIHLKLPFISSLWSYQPRLMIAWDSRKENEKLLIVLASGYKNIIEHLIYGESKKEIKQLDLTYGKFPLQFELTPFLVANFQTLQFAEKEKRKLYEEQYGKVNKKTLSRTNFIFKADKSEHLESFRDFSRRFEKTTDKIFECTFDFKLEYMRNLLIKLNMNDLKREKETIDLFYKNKLINTIVPVYVNQGKESFLYWKPLNKCQKLKDCDFTSSRKSHSDDDDLIPYWEKEFENNDYE